MADVCKEENMGQDAKERVIFYSNKISANNALIEKYKVQVEMLDECIKKLNTGIADIEDVFFDASFLFHHYNIDEECWYGDHKTDFEDRFVDAYDSSVIHFLDKISSRLEDIEKMKDWLCAEIADLAVDNIKYRWLKSDAEAEDKLPD